LSVRRNFGGADGLDITRRCWGGSEPVEKEEDKGIGESVRRGSGNESAEELVCEVRGARGDGSDSGGGVRLIGGAVITKLDEKTIRPKRIKSKTYDREPGRRSFWTSSRM
jgi:hypothetical protein